MMLAAKPGGGRPLHAPVWGWLAAVAAAIWAGPASGQPVPPVQVGFLWHMHQPIYYPGETIIQTTNAGRFSFSVTDVHNQRLGPYTTWPKDAIQIGSALPHLGASVSFSGSLIKNLNDLEAAGYPQWKDWEQAYRAARSATTVRGNPRLDLIGFSQYHALGPLLDTRDLRMQIKLHKLSSQDAFGTGVPYAKGFFPAETAFSTRMIPALVAEGFDWTIVDNIHFDRATKNYPHTDASNLSAPNRADAVNPDPTASGGAWVQLNNLWAPSKVSAPFSYRPHRVQYVDPNTGATQQIVAVPGARYEGNEDARGGYGALQYKQVMDQYKQFNTDPNRPLLVVLHHDGDNYGGGSESYYHGNFQNMVNWAASDPDYDVTTIQDYIDRFPVPATDVIHVEPGSWAGADNGDPQFRKWLGPRNAAGWSPDQNSWAVLTAAKNRVFTAEDKVPIGDLRNVLNGVGSATEKAWHHLLESQASDYWYWDGTEIWDSDVTRGANLAVQQADQVLAALPGAEATAPTVFLPQRSSWNPGGKEFGVDQPKDFEVWTFAYDVSGLQNVTLKYRVDADGDNPLGSTQNETYSGGAEVGGWQSLTMSGVTLSSPAGILTPTYRAQRFAATVAGLSDKLVDYYVEATDAFGNLTKTDIQHVYVGTGSGTTGGGGGGGNPGGGGTNPAPSGFTMDGALDASATLVAEKSGMKLWWAANGSSLYVATPDAGEGSDHFVFIAKTPGGLVAAPWAKAGQVAQWDAYLADENDNTYSAWFDAQAAGVSATGANGGVLEGVIDLVDEFGAYPDAVYLAVGLYGNGNGGTLLASHQLPGTLDTDGSIQANEYLRVPLAALAVTLDVPAGRQTQGQAGRPTIAGNSRLIKTGSGTCVLDAANGFIGGTDVQAGVLEVAHPAALVTSAVTVAAHAKLRVADSVRVTVKDLSLVGAVDVGGGITVTAGLADAEIRSALQAGRAAGSWNGTSGVMSSAVEAALAAGAPRTVGWVRGGDGSVTFAFAAPGDTNLDGVVDILDAAAIAGGGRFDSWQPAAWIEGDSNNDAVVDILDVADMMSTGLFDAGAYLPAAGPGVATAVPEPAAGALVVVAAVACWLAGRRPTPPRDL
jgi:autotransporter-associated beta strand protein